MLQPLPLRGFDEECRQFLAEQYEQNGINLHVSSTPQAIEKGADGKFTLVCQGPDKKEFRLDNLDAVLMATGRHPNTKNIGLEEVGPLCFCHWASSSEGRYTMLPQAFACVSDSQ